ncbi:MAG: tetratricopeptide repeat protein [Armatimonadota bacterium]
MPQCPTCGREVQTGANFCPACGGSLHSPAIAAMIQDALKTLAQNSDDAAARYNLAVAYKLAGSDELALVEFATVAELQPDFADAFYEMGLLQAKLGRRDDAVRALTRAYELEPDNARVLRLLERLTSSDSS